MKPWRWLASGQRIHWPRVLFVSVLSVALITIIAVGLTSTAAFGLYNPSWDGASDLRDHLDDQEETDVTILTAASEYDELDGSDSTVFLLAPEATYSEDERAAVEDYLDRGGNVVVLDNFPPHTNALLADLDAQARLDGQFIRDELNYHASPAMPVTGGITNHTMTTGVSELTFNHVMAVQPGNATVLVQTSEFSYLTDTPSDELANNVTLSEYPVATVESVGNGSLVLVGDPSLTINAMLAESDNRAFIDALYGDSQTVAIDVSTHESLPPLQAMMLAIEDSQALQLSLGLVGILSLVVIGRLDHHHLTRQLRQRLSIQTELEQKE